MRLEWFFSDPPPAVVAYRTSSPDQISARVDAVLERLSREVEFVRSDAQPDWVSLEPIGAHQQHLDPEALAAQARAIAKIGNHPIRSMSEFASRIGVLLFSADLGPNSPDSASSPVGPVGVAVVNGHRAVGRRRLAAGHEIGHLLRGDQYEVDWRVDQPDQDVRESKLDQFARALLLPEAPLRSSWSMVDSPDFPERAQALREASHRQVDMSTLARRLEQLGIVDRAAADRIRQYRHRRSDFDELDLVNRTDLDPVTLPKAYARSVLKLYRRGDVSADRAVDLLMAPTRNQICPRWSRSPKDPSGPSRDPSVSGIRHRTVVRLRECRRPRSAEAAVDRIRIDPGRTRRSGTPQRCPRPTDSAGRPGRDRPRTGCAVAFRVDTSGNRSE